MSQVKGLSTKSGFTWRLAKPDLDSIGKRYAVGWRCLVPVVALCLGTDTKIGRSHGAIGAGFVGVLPAIADDATFFAREVVA